MERLKRWFIRIAAGERGQDMVEYTLIAVVAVNLSGAFGVWAAEVCNEVAPDTC